MGQLREQVDRRYAPDSIEARSSARVSANEQGSTPTTAHTAKGPTDVSRVTNNDAG